jgi:hypothetical protein
MTNKDFLFGIAEQLRRVLQPLARSLETEGSFAQLLEKYGWLVEPESFSITNVRDAFDIQDDITKVAQLLAEINAPTDISLPDVSKYVELVETLKQIVLKVQNLFSQPAPVGLPPELWASFGGELLEGLLADYLETYRPILFAFLLVAGAVEEEAVIGGTAGRKDYIRRRFVWSRLGSAIINPTSLAREVYGWNDPDHHFKFGLFLDRLGRFIALLGIPIQVQVPPQSRITAYYNADNPFWEQARELRMTLMRAEGDTGQLFDTGLYVMPVPPRPNTVEAPNGFVIGSSIVASGALPVQAIWPFTLELYDGFQSDDALRLEIWPGQANVTLGQPGTTSLDAMAVITQLALTPSVLLGSRMSHRLLLHGWQVHLRVKGAPSDPEVELEFGLEDAEAIVDGSDADGFLQSILPPDGLRVTIDAGVGWSNRKGIYFRGGAGLESTLPVHVNLLDVLRVDSVYLALRARGEDIQAIAAATAAIKLGPLHAQVERLGLLATLNFPQEGGNLGSANVELDFKPPSGVGISIDAGAVTGGGFLFFDPEEEQYAGAVHLEIEGGISLNAIGLLTTRLPDGSKGFSLLVIVTASGFTPIQLGFGFALTGVGGLLGINRTVAIDVLRAGVRSRALEPILFSQEDPTPRAPAIISTLRSVFPPVRDRYVFGPMAIIGWGTPTVLTIEVAVLLELLAPLRLIVLGRLRALLPGPDERAALVKLNMDVFGVVDFDRREVSIDATLYDSYVSAFAISGDMALRASWGERPGFALAVGGFHPRFQPPPEFPALRRLSISLSTSDNPRLRLEAYLAITSNTVQLGARLDLYVEALGFNLAGMLSFDALVQFAPFGLDLEVAGMLALRRGTRTLMGLALRMRLTGPDPWHARGEATFRILFIKITIGFDARFGEERLQPSPEPVEIWPHLKEALCDPRNWGAELPGEGSAFATVRAVDPPTGEVLVHPQGEVSVRQRVVPLERDISRFANAPPADYRCFHIASVSAGDKTLAHQDTYEHFAPAQFEEMPDDRKLASPGFDPMPAGARASGVALKAGPDRAVTLGYETIVVEPPGEPPAQPLPETYTPAADTLALLAETGAAATAELRRSGRAKFATDGNGRVAVSDPEFAVVTREGLAPPDELSPTDGSFTGAREELRRLVAENPHYRGNVQVVRREEALV